MSQSAKMVRSKGPKKNRRRSAQAEMQASLDGVKAELAAAYAREAATAEVLQVINASPGDLAQVFDAMLERAMRLCEAQFGYFLRYQAGRYVLTAERGLTPAFAQYFSSMDQPGPGEANTRILEGAPYIHLADLRDDEPYRSGTPLRRATVDLGGFRTGLAVPLRKDGELLGTMSLGRDEVRPFTDKQIALVQSFAAQAVIAMENARLLGELRERTRDLEEALEYQTATSDVLKVISRSTFDVNAVLDFVSKTAGRLCAAQASSIFRLDGDVYRWATGHDVTPGYRAIEEQQVITPGTGTLVGRVALAEDVVHILDAMADPLYERKDDLKVAGLRTVLGVPLLREGVAIGVICLGRQAVRAYSDKQIELVRTFADQAVIAIENTRLLGELRERTRDLEESLAYQTATSNVLQVISRSTFDLDAVLKTMVETALRLCRAEYGVIFRSEDGKYRFAAGHGNSPEYEQRERNLVIRPSRGTIVGRAVLEGRAVQILDAITDPEYDAKDDARLNGAHTMLGVPLVRDGQTVGAFGLARGRIAAFSERDIDLVSTFADQAVIAIENARLITEIREARDSAEKALGELKAAQANLIQAEKMASLGQLTAGIAHEIKNPLNFVNNFAGLSVELLDELKEAAAPALEALGEDACADIDQAVAFLTGNLDKIAEHGQRADNIVKSMLEHSRGISGERRMVDLNVLVDEALNLAYHGARAQDQSFNITMERDFDPALAPVELAPQDMTRVFLNLIGNGFYAAIERARESGDGVFRPILAVATREADGAVEVRVRDNGTGIPSKIKDQLFQPFFTTKPTGEGTGLGLSISYDIVTQQHGGTITVDSEPGAYTEFTVRLPRDHQPAGASA